MGYDRAAAAAYAYQWAFSRNPAYLDFTGIGGDCTNFVSQCLYAGGGVMNYAPLFGWYYRTAENRTPSWTGVEERYRFLISNAGPGPYAREAEMKEAVIGDVVQLGYPGERFTHSLLVVGKEKTEIYIAVHSDDAWMRPLSSYQQPVRRLLHIDGVRQPSSVW